jgi:hypothetical protein
MVLQRARQGRPSDAASDDEYFHKGSLLK